MSVASGAQRCMANLPPTKELIGLKIPYGAWEPDTLITDTFGNPIFSVLDVQHHAMGAYEAIFGDENGHKLCYVKRRLITKYWKDGWDFCTYQPNFPGQPKYKERDMYGKSVYPFSSLMVRPLKCRYAYSVHEEDMESMDTFLEAMHGWLGSMTVCCTPMVRLGKWQIDFHRPGSSDPEINIDQSKNLLEVERGNDLLAALCIAYAFDKALCQPLVTIIGYQEKEHMDDDDDSLDGDFEEAMQYPALPAPDYSQPQEETRGLPYEQQQQQQPDVDGYLENEPYNDNPEVDGYLESEPYYDNPEVDGYLEGEPNQKTRSAPAGYLESDNPDNPQYTDNPQYLEEGHGYHDDRGPDGYIEDGGGGGYSDHPDGYIENGEGGDYDDDNNAGYIENDRGDHSFIGSSTTGSGQHVEGESFKDEEDID